MRKKRKGSTMVIAITVFFMLITLGTVLLSATTYAYKNQINQSKRVQNLYESESGLDVTYNVMAKAIEAAIFASDTAVEKTFYNTGGIIEKERQNVTNYLRNPASYDVNQMIYYDASSATKSELFDLVGTKVVINDTALQEKQNEVFKKNYCVFLSNNLEKYIEEGKFVKNMVEEALESPFVGTVETLYLAFKGEITTRMAVFDTFSYDLSTKPNFKVDVPVYDIASSDLGNLLESLTEIPVKVESQFYTGIVEDNAGATSNVYDTNKSGVQERRIAVEYKLDIPEYNPANAVKKVEIVNIPVFKRSFASEKNIVLEGEVEIDGNVYAKGIDDGSLDGQNVFKKYNGGIIIGSDDTTIPAKIEINGEVVTPKSVSLRDYSTLEMDGEMYASNLHLGKYKEDGVELSNIANNIRVNTINTTNKLDLYLRNDLSIYANHSSINLNNFYGLNDVSNNDINDKTLKSSSILINSTTNVNVNVNGDAYILGTAYINTQNGYQTGESIAVKGNYKAYSNSLEGQSIGSTTEKYTNLQFEYDKPLQLVVSMEQGGSQTLLNVYDKAQYFVDYTKDNNDKLNKSVVVNLLGKKVSVGAIINGDAIEGASSGLLDEQEKIVNLQNLYSNKVFGFDVVNMKDKFYLTDDSKIVSISNELNFSKLTNRKETSSAYNYDVLFNNDKNKGIVIVGSGVTDTQVTAYEAANKIVYDCRNPIGDAWFEGAILSAGDVEFVGGINFTGTVIAGGNITLDGKNDKKTFVYDEDVVKRVIALYYDELYKGENHADNVIIKPNDLYKQIVELEWTTSRNHNVKEYIEQNTWSIEK